MKSGAGPVFDFPKSLATVPLPGELVAGFERPDPGAPPDGFTATYGSVAVQRYDAQSVTFVGSSLGGFYATWFAEKYDRRAVLINPAIRPDLGLAAYLGPQRNLYTGEAFELTPAHLEAWRALVMDRVDPERYLLLLETGDEVLDWRAAARKYEGARTVIRDGGDHTLQSFAEHLPRILAFAGMDTG